MTHRTGIRLAGTLFALLLFGCSSDGPGAPETHLMVSPLFAGIIEGSTMQLEATFDGEPAEVTWESEDESILTVSPTGLVTGVNPGIAAATATMVGHPTRRRSASITVIEVPTLTSGEGLTVAGATDSERFFQVIVPQGATRLVVQTSGGTGDVDLYVRQGAVPSQASWDCRPWAGGNNETCAFDDPAPGPWFIMLHAYEAYASVTLRATITP